MSSVVRPSCHVCDRDYVEPNGGICGECGRPTCLACFTRLAVLDDPCQNGTACADCARVTVATAD